MPLSSTADTVTFSNSTIQVTLRLALTRSSTVGHSRRTSTASSQPPGPAGGAVDVGSGGAGSGAGSGAVVGVGGCGRLGRSASPVGLLHAPRAARRAVLDRCC